MITRVSPLIIYLQTLLFLILANYYMNPLKMTSHCLTGHSQSQTLGSGTIVDCVACLNLDSRDVIQSRVIGDIDVLLPDKLKNKANARLPIDAVEGRQGKLGNQLLIIGKAYEQTGCLLYQCSDFLDPKDFDFKGSQLKQKLAQNGLQQISKVDFAQASSIIKEWLSGWSKQYTRVSSDSFSRDNISSIMVRFRYNAPSKIEAQTSPIFIFHQIPDNIFIRLLFLAPLLFQIVTLKLFLASHISPFISNVIVFLISLSFFTEHLALLGALLAICIIVALMLQEKVYGVILGLILVFAQLGYQYGQLPLLTITICIVGIQFSVLYFWKGQETKVELIQAIVTNQFHVVIGYLFNWNFLLIVSPINLLVALLYLQEQRQEPKRSYKNIHEIEEQEDVLVKIQRALDKH